jgi:hypothetical protein
MKTLITTFTAALFTTGGGLFFSAPPPPRYADDYRLCTTLDNIYEALDRIEATLARQSADDADTAERLISNESNSKSR